MKSFILLACFALTAADVSHLATRYLPPPAANKTNNAADAGGGEVTTTIEQHELRELPEQIEYMRDGMTLPEAQEEPIRELMPPSLAAPEIFMHQPLEQQQMEQQQMEQQQMEQQQMQQQQQMENQISSAAPTMATANGVEAPVNEYLAPAAMSADMMRAVMQELMPMIPAMQYLPPAVQEQKPMQQQQQPNEQLTYQQYQQQQMPHPAEQQNYDMMMMMLQMQNAPDMVEPQQPIAPSDAEYLTPDIEPAHELRMDGYHYRAAPDAKRLRH